MENPKEPSKELNKDKKIDSLSLKLLIYSLNKDCMLALVQDLDNQGELMATSLKVKNSNFMPKKLNPERNDHQYLLFNQ